RALYLFAFLVVILAAWIVNPFAGRSETAKADQLSKEFKDEITDFQKASGEAAAELANNTGAVVKKLASESTDVKGASEAWEDTVKEIGPQVNQLEQKLEILRKVAEKYFSELVANTDPIQNPAFREGEVKKDARVREDWAKIYRQASSN